MSQRVVQVVPVGDNLDALFVGLREFPTKKIVLLAPPDKLNDAKDLAKRLVPFKLPVNIIELKGSNILEKMFEVIAGLKKEESFSRDNPDSKGEDSIIVNVATGDRISTCAALSASYVNGIRAFSVLEDRIMLLPMLKFSFNKLISEKKTEVIKTLSNVEQKSFEDLARSLKMSAPLLSYHLNGDRETSGLIDLGLVEWVTSPSFSPVAEDREKNGGRTSSSNSRETGKRVKLTSMGVLFYNGYCR